MSKSPARDPWQEIDAEIRKAIGYPHVTVEDLPADTFVARFFRARAAVEAQHQQALAAKDAEIADANKDFKWMSQQAATRTAERDEALTQLQQVTQERDTLIGQLAECYRLSGADPDGDSDAHLAPYAVQEVRRLREESDADNKQLDAKVTRLRDALAITRNSVGDLRRGFANCVDPARWVEQLQAHIDAALTSRDATPARGTGAATMSALQDRLDLMIDVVIERTPPCLI